MADSIELKGNIKQQEYIKEVLLSSTFQSNKRYFFYGGAIRGGKTTINIAALLCLCKMFPGSRWHVIRADMPVLYQTTIPSFEKFIPASKTTVYHRASSNYHIEFKKYDSKIFFRGENIAQDPTLDSFLGLESNGFFLEQVEELSVKMFEMAKQRAGSWIIPNMPPPLILSTFNPTQTWIKEQIYEKYMNGTLPESYYYQSAMPSDNPYVTDEQWKSWDNLDEPYKKQFIHGDWTDYLNRDSLWAYNFVRSKHVSQTELFINPDYELFLSFDFNRNPSCACVIQYYNDCVYVIETIKLMGAGTESVCDYILEHYPDNLYIVNGDYSGNTASNIFNESITNYTVIKTILKLNAGQIQIEPNPSLKENQRLVNLALKTYNIQICPKKAKGLIFDLENCKRRADGSIVKEDRNDPKQQSDILDGFRYFCNKNLKWLLKLHPELNDIPLSN
jgi:hypothetical protein